VTTATKRISPGELGKHIEGDGAHRLIDVRNPDEYEVMHVRGAENVPLMQLLDHACEWDRNQPLMLICHQGPRSENAVRQLEVAGFADLAMVEGGTLACSRARVPVVRGRRRFSIQQQMQLIVGPMILAGAIGSFFYTPLIVLTFIGGCGLLMAGTTGFCPLVNVLNRAPWNQPKKVCAAPPSDCSPGPRAKSCCGG